MQINRKLSIKIFILFFAIFLPSCAARDLYNLYEESKEARLREIEAIELEGEVMITDFLRYQLREFYEGNRFTYFSDIFYIQEILRKEYPVSCTDNGDVFCTDYDILVSEDGWESVVTKPYPENLLDKGILLFSANYRYYGQSKYRRFIGKIEAQFTTRTPDELKRENDSDDNSDMRTHTFGASQYIDYETYYLAVKYLLCKQIDITQPLIDMSLDTQTCPSNSEKVEIYLSL